jgi:hypothetical protein
MSFSESFHRDKNGVHPRGAVVPKSLRFICGGLSLFLAGCLTWSAAHDEVLRSKIEKDLWGHLAVGDPAEKIEKVLRDQGVAFSFDRFDSRYQAVIEPREKRMIVRKVGIYLYVDANQRLTKIEVTNSYTYF